MTLEKRGKLVGLITGGLKLISVSKKHGRGSSPVLVPLSQVGRVVHPVVLGNVIQKPPQVLVDSRD